MCASSFGRLGIPADPSSSASLIQATLSSDVDYRIRVQVVCDRIGPIEEEGRKKSESEAQSSEREFLEDRVL